MSNNITANSLVVYARRRDGTLVLLNIAQLSGGKGGILNAGSGVNPLISQFSVILTPNRRFVLVVNAGSNTVSVLRILSNFDLQLVSITRVVGTGPVSIAIRANLIYVASTDADGKFDAISEQKGILSAYRLTSSGKLIFIRRSIRKLSFRPSTIQFSPDGRSLVVSDPFAAANALSSGNLKEILVFRVLRSGLLSSRPVSSAASTQIGNKEGRNLPAAQGFEVVRRNGVQYVVVPELRLVGSDGMPADSQTSSISVWMLSSFSSLVPVQLDVLVGSSFTSGQRESCWMEFVQNGRMFFISNTASNSISSFSFRGGKATLLEEVAASGENPIDLWSSSDGKFLYQMFSGSVGAFKIGRTGTLEKIQMPMNVPEMNAQGIVAF